MTIPMWLIWTVGGIFAILFFMFLSAVLMFDSISEGFIKVFWR